MEFGAATACGGTPVQRPGGTRGHASLMRPAKSAPRDAVRGCAAARSSKRQRWRLAAGLTRWRHGDLRCPVCALSRSPRRRAQHHAMLLLSVRQVNSADMHPPRPSAANRERNQQPRSGPASSYYRARPCPASGKKMSGCGTLRCRAIGLEKIAQAGRMSCEVESVQRFWEAD